MAITFTDAQIKELTGQALEAPNKVTNAELNKEKAVKLKQDYKDLDQINEVYSTNFRNIIFNYHEELKYISGNARTSPDLALIEPSGKRTPGNHYFPNDWLNFQPKLSDQDRGLPITTWANTETEAITRLNSYVTLLTTGFNPSGSFNQTISASTATTITVTATTGASVGNPIVVYGPTGYAYGTITTITPGVAPAPSTITINVAHGNLATVGASATATNTDAGFTLAQRDTGVAGNRNQYLLGLRGLIDTAAADTKTRAQAVQTALNANDAKGPEEAEILAARTLVTNFITEITNWEAFPQLGSGTSRHGTNLPVLQTANTTRQTQYAARITQIETALGSATQVIADGKFSGSGNYIKYFENLNQRLNITSGTLRNFYQQDLAIQVSEQEIDMAKSQAARDTQSFVIRVFSSDAKGTDRVSVTDASGLSVGQSVKVTSNTQPVLNLTIVGINDLEIQLSASIPTSYTVTDKARIVKQN